MMITLSSWAEDSINDANSFGVKASKKLDFAGGIETAPLTVSVAWGLRQCPTSIAVARPSWREFPQRSTDSAV